MLHLRWKYGCSRGRALHVSPEPIPAGRGRFYYLLGILELACILIYFNLATLWRLFDIGTFSAMIFGVALAHGLLKTSRTLATIPDVMGDVSSKSHDSASSYQASDEEMTRIGIAVIGAAVVFTLMLCLYLTSISDNSPWSRPPWWLGIPTILVILAAVWRRCSRS